MLRTFTVAIAVAFCLAGAAGAQSTSNDTFKPGPENDPNNCSDLWRGIGLPQYSREEDRDTIIVCHYKYVLSHNNKDKTPDWVIEHLTTAQISGTNARPKMKFKPEPFVPSDKRAVDDDYRNSKFDRGHQAPSDDFKAKREWMVESFFLSNIVPQVGIGFNRGIWKNFEDHVRDIVRDRGELYAITGPIESEEAGSGTVTITDTTNICRNKIVLKPLKKESICGAKAKCGDGVTVPIALFKIIYDPRLHRANAFILPNINHRDTGKGFADAIEYLKKFQVNVEVVEKYTGLEFFRDLPLRSRRPILQQCTAFMEH